MNFVTISYHSTNYYALETNNGKLLIDCGWPGTFPQFTSELKRKGIVPGEIKYLLVTHFHPDHAGLVQEFKKLGAKLILMESQVGYIAPMQSMIKTKDISYTEILEDDNLNLTFNASREFLASLGIVGEILATPGHSPDSVTLILDEGLAFTGDLPPRFLVSEEDEVARDSWDKIYRRPIKRIYPSHGS